MIIPGYLDGFAPPVDPATLVDATGWLADQAAWPALLHTVGGSSMALEAFDADPADVDAMLTELSWDDHWPVFSLGLTGGHRVDLVWRNFDGDSGWDYLHTVKGHSESFEIVRWKGISVARHGHGRSWQRSLQCLTTSWNKLNASCCCCQRWATRTYRQMPRRLWLTRSPGSVPCAGEPRSRKNC